MQLKPPIIVNVPARERVELISCTSSPNCATPEELIALIARVSSSKSPEDRKKDYVKLLKYCVRNAHWSIFEMVDLTFLITTTRALAPQFIRHKSFSFMEFSQRYSSPMHVQLCEPRMQDPTNRQSSLPCNDMEVDYWFYQKQRELYVQAMEAYDKAISMGIAKECARALLPLNTVTQFYMKGSLRSWIHYCEVRMKPETQKEHREIAEVVWEKIIEIFPTLKEL